MIDDSKIRNRKQTSDLNNRWLMTAKSEIESEFEQSMVDEKMTRWSHSHNQSRNRKLLKFEGLLGSRTIESINWDSLDLGNWVLSNSVNKEAKEKGKR